jgi:uncharacterized iron-regulated membrane protein
MLRRYHRWIGFAAAIFIIGVTLTGVILEIQKLSGREEDENTSSSYKLGTSLGRFGPLLQKAEENAKVKVGSAGIDSVELRLNDTPPRFIFHTTGNEKQKLTINSETGNIEKLEDDEESFILRLHSGEIFGEPGVGIAIVGGIALLFLTVTGLIIYWQMRKSAKGKKGLGRIFWVFLVFFLMPKPVMACMSSATFGHLTRI